MFRIFRSPPGGASVDFPDPGAPLACTSSGRWPPQPVITVLAAIPSGHAGVGRRERSGRSRPARCIGRQAQGDKPLTVTQVHREICGARCGVSNRCGSLTVFRWPAVRQHQRAQLDDTPYHSPQRPLWDGDRGHGCRSCGQRRTLNDISAQSLPAGNCRCRWATPSRLTQARPAAVSQRCDRYA